jgi:WD40 repeat protein
VAKPPGSPAGGGCQKDISIRVWDVASGKPVVVFQGHLEGEKPGDHGGETSLAFSPDGSILSGGYDGTMRLWDIRTGKEVRRFEGHSAGVAVAFSPDGRRALSGGFGDRTVRLWDVDTGKELHRLTGHKGGVTGVALSPDGRFAVSGSADNTARLWRLPDPPAAKDKP